MHRTSTPVPEFSGRPAWADACFGVLLLLAIALLAQPYAGLRHDGILYLGQILERLDPGSLKADLFFAFGSQDQYSLYSVLLAPLYRVLSIGTVQVLVLMACQLAFYGALYRLLGLIGAGPWRWPALLFSAALSHGYGADQIVSYGENFLTGRSLAEPLILWALVAQLERRILGTLALLLLALLVHPLLTLPALLLVWLVWVQADRRLAFAFVLLGGLPLLAWAGVHPFDGLLTRYDEAWWRLVSEVNVIALLQHWIWSDWQGAVIDLAVLSLAASGASERWARLCRACALAALLLMSVAAIGADLGHNRLLTQLQLWRVMWLVHALALCLAPLLASRAWSSGPAGQMLAVAMLAALLAASAQCSMSWVFLAWAGLWWLLLQRRVRVDRRLVWLSSTVIFICLLLISAGKVADTVFLSLQGYAAPVQQPLWVRILAQPTVLLTIAGISWFAWRHRTRALLGASGALGGMALLLSTAITHGDLRSDWIRKIEDSPRSAESLSRLIPPHAQVYWPDQMAASWALLHRAAYYQKAQGAGLLFNAATAHAFGPRWDAWTAQRQHANSCRLESALLARDPAACLQPSTDEMRALCRTQAEMDYFILDRSLSISALAVWDPQLPSYPSQRFHLYACQQLR